MDENPGLALLLAMGGGFWMFTALAGCLYGWKTGRRGLAKVFGAALVLVSAAYLGTLAAVSLTSREVRLAPGDRKAFCGFYLDCHVGVSVEGVERNSMLYTESGALRPAGSYWLVDLELSSDARRAALTPGALEIYVVDAAGTHYPRDVRTESILAGHPVRRAFDEPLPAGSAYTRRLVFDLPAAVKEPRLVVRPGFLPDRIIETFLIGDDDSWLHPRTSIRLDA